MPFGLVNAPSVNTKNNPPFVWKSNHDHAYETLRSHIVGEKILALYDQKKNHEVHTDASATGLTGVLMQVDGKLWRPGFYYSRHTNDAERNYHSYELEVLPIVESLERFKTCLLGKRFRVVTDCGAVATTKLHTPLMPRIARWWLKLQEFDFETIHRPTEQMQHGDALSINPVEMARERTSRRTRMTGSQQCSFKTQKWIDHLRGTKMTHRPKKIENYSN